MHHVFTRGNNKHTIFLEDSDWRYFLRVLSSVVEDLAWICHSYCLMPNHYHLLIETPEGGLSKGMHVINGYYSSMFNRKYGNVGHVMQGRFHSPLVTKESHLLELLRYMALNPVKDGFARHPSSWNWSSYRPLAGMTPCPSLLTVSLALGLFSEEIMTAHELYERFVLERLDEALEASEGTPDLAKLLGNCASRTERNAAMVTAHLKYGYKLSEIADYFNISCSTVSRVLSAYDQGRCRERTRAGISPPL